MNVISCIWTSWFTLVLAWFGFWEAKGLAMLPRLSPNSWTQVIFQIQPAKFWENGSIPPHPMFNNILVNISWENLTKMSLKRIKACEQMNNFVNKFWPNVLHKDFLSHHHQVTRCINLFRLANTISKIREYFLRFRNRSINQISVASSNCSLWNLRQLTQLFGTFFCLLLSPKHLHPLCSLWISRLVS